MSRTALTGFDAYRGAPGSARPTDPDLDHARKKHDLTLKACYIFSILPPDRKRGAAYLTRDDPTGFAAPPAFGPFRVLHQIGVGALGPVFRTYEPTRDRLVAVKVFRLDIRPNRRPPWRTS